MDCFHGFFQLIMGEYEWMSYGKYAVKVDLVGRGLLSLGVRPKQNLCVLAETRMEWMLVAQACFRNNFPLVTLYSTLGEDGLIHGESKLREFFNEMWDCLRRYEFYPARLILAVAARRPESEISRGTAEGMSIT